MDQVDVVIGILGLVITLFSIAFGVWAFVVKASTAQFSERLTKLLDAQNMAFQKSESKIDAVTQQIRSHEKSSLANFKEIKEDMECLRERMQGNVNYHSNRVTKIEAHIEKEGFIPYKNGGHT